MVTSASFPVLYLKTPINIVDLSTFAEGKLVPDLGVVPTTLSAGCRRPGRDQVISAYVTEQCA